MTERESPARRLRGGVFPVLDAASENARRERVAARVLDVSRKLTARRERRRRWVLGVALAALVGSAGAAALVSLPGGSADAPELLASREIEVQLLAGHASVRNGAGLVPLAEGAVQLGADTELSTPADESAELRLSSATQVSVAPASAVNISRQRPSPGVFEERLRLRAGSVALAVPKLGARGKVSVETRDALVEVHGTRFSVRVVEAASGPAFTEVAVREGRVLVSSGGQSRMLGPGDSFSTRAAEAAPIQVPSPSADTANGDAGAARATKTAAPRARRLAPRRPRASELAEQNRLLEAAELAARNDMSTLALERLEQLITRYPDAELAHNARVERFRLLERSGRHAQAVAAARAYLERHPDGFARDEAARLIGAAP